MSIKKKHHTSKVLYHYTNVESLLSIIKNYSFRATNIRSFSDKQELVGGLIPLRQSFLSKIMKNEPNGFATYLSKRLKDSNIKQESFNVISFCTKRNYNYMWNHYAKNNGCCICFKKSKLLDAFNQNKLRVFYGDKEREHSLHPIKETFMKCKYISKKNLPREAKHSLNKFKIKYSDGTIVPFDPQERMVYTERMTREMLNDPDGTAKRDADKYSLCFEMLFVDLIGIALCTKIARTVFNYEKEKEERLVFYPPQYPQTIKSTNIKSFKREYLTIQLNKQIFLSSIKEIQINPKAKNNASLVSEVTTVIKEIYRNVAMHPPVIKGMPNTYRGNKKTICRSFYRKRFKKLCKKTGWQSSMCYRGD